jgi:hypothetical protein
MKFYHPDRLSYHTITEGGTNYSDPNWEERLIDAQDNSSQP